MKERLKKLCVFGAIALLPMGFTSCDDDDDNSGSEEEVYGPVIASYVDNTVVPTYKALAEAALKMRTANNKLKENKTDANLQEAADAWMAARIEWELSEAFLFGPVGEDAMDIDGHIDSWPLEIDDINGKLEEISENPEAFTGEDAWDETGDVIGFHVTEYLLYREGRPRAAADVTEAELHYLTAATDALIWDCVLAYVAWVGEDNVSSDMKSVFNENPAVVAHLNSNPNYKDFAYKMKTATGNYDGNWKGAFEEISVGATDIADEVGATKIESPYVQGNVLEVESWYSWHSLEDYENNILSIKGAFYGKKGATTAQANSLSAYLAKVDSELNQKVAAQIEDCITKIKAIGTGGKSFYEVVRDQINGTQVDAAVEACTKLADVFEEVKNKDYIN
ncbi:MAG: hypothetical protein LBG18_04970 [Mediterranea sp.]|jgi:predicted lipoprotein|nr:hypothetical protein [Mediterranea sp.]